MFLYNGRLVSRFAARSSGEGGRKLAARKVLGFQFGPNARNMSRCGPQSLGAANQLRQRFAESQFARAPLGPRLRLRLEPPAKLSRLAFIGRRRRQRRLTALFSRRPRPQIGRQRQDLAAEKQIRLLGAAHLGRQVARPAGADRKGIKPVASCPPCRALINCPGRPINPSGAGPVQSNLYIKPQRRTDYFGRLPASEPAQLRPP